MLGKLLGRRPGLVGIDVGTRTITVVRAEVRGAQVRVLSAGQVATPPGCLHEGQVLNAKLLGEGIRQALTEARITTRAAALAVPAQFGFVRRVTFPKMPLKELRATIELQPERYIPLAREGSVFDVNILPGETNDGQMTVVVAAAPRKHVQDLMDACKAAGVKPVRIDLEPLALHRALVGAGLAGKEMATAIVDLGASGAKISLFEGPVPVVTRVVDMPHSTVDGVSDFYAGTGTEDLFLDIRRSLEFALNQTGTRPSRVFIAGGAGDDGYLHLSLTGYLRSFLSGRLPEDFQVAPVQASNLDVPQSHMLALGLSLHPELFQ